MTRSVPTLSLLSFLFLVSTGCAHMDHAQDEMEIRQLVAAQTEAWNKGDAAAWTKDFTPDSEFINIVGSVFEGREQIEQRHAAIFATLFKGSQDKVTVRKIVFPEPNIAVVDAVHEVTGHSGLPPGVQNTESGLLRTQMKYVMKKTDGQWQILAGHNTDVKPAR
ncbi:SgcJ/EcaC family oxidoreductase [Archangium violaceum]|uniref:SgcJ/EcaC family oxidoreductase n=1 Tax=Archangium violaceum TaxID=83451 RepID=UPI002B2A5F4E|nr:SgcJ/EcaC family oxidoreductase [Archangium violaceum]